MRVLIGSPAFPPSLGGIERFAELMALGLATLGDDVTVLTSTPADALDHAPFRVLRCPGPLAKLRAVRDCDVFLQANVSLRDAWPLLLFRRPWVVSHHGLYSSRGLAGLLGRLKIRLGRLATSRISVSRFVADRVDPESQVIANPYRSSLFRVLEGVDRSRDLIFVGRLVSDKGTQVLLRAVDLAAREGRRMALAIVGDGPEVASLRNEVQSLGLSSYVTFLGRLDGPELVGELNRSRVLVVPSIVEEGFGLVALEGIACGCRVVASDVGGLREAVGSCGRLVAAGDPKALSRALIEELNHRDSESYRASADKHLSHHREGLVVERYREILTASLGAKRP